MRELLLDTDMLSEVFKGRDAGVAAHGAAYRVSHRGFTFSLVSKFEVLRGLKWSNATAQLASFAKVCRDARILRVDDSIVERAAQLWADAKKTGKPGRSADVVIAATALEHGLPLCTGNTA